MRRRESRAVHGRGGKLLIAPGAVDQTVSTRATERYYQRLPFAMGVGAIASFVRFCEIPGRQHAVGTEFNASWDSLTSLVAIDSPEKKRCPARSLRLHDSPAEPGPQPPADSGRYAVAALACMAGYRGAAQCLARQRAKRGRVRPERCRARRKLDVGTRRVAFR